MPDNLKSQISLIEEMIKKGENPEPPTGEEKNLLIHRPDYITRYLQKFGGNSAFKWATHIWEERKYETIIDFIEELTQYKEWKPSDSVWKFINQLKDGFQSCIGNNYFVDNFSIKKDENTVFCLFFFTTHIKGFEKIESLDFLNILISPNIFINIPNYTMYHFDNVIIRMNAQHTTFFASIFYVLLIVILVVMNFLFYIIVKKNIISMNNLKISAQEYALSERTMSYLIGILHHKLNTPLKVLATKSRVLIRTIINNNIPEYIKEKSEWDYVQIDNSLKTIFNVTSKLKTYNALSQNELNLYKLFTISKETSDILKDDEFEIDIDYKSKMFEINKLHLTSHEIIHIFINQIKCSLVLLADKISIKVLKSDKEYVTILYTDNGNKINKNIFDINTLSSIVKFSNLSLGINEP